MVVRLRQSRSRSPKKQFKARLTSEKVPDLLHIDLHIADFDHVLDIGGRVEDLVEDLFAESVTKLKQRRRSAISLAQAEAQ